MIRLQKDIPVQNLQYEVGMESERICENSDRVNKLRVIFGVSTENQTG